MLSLSLTAILAANSGSMALDSSAVPLLMRRPTVNSTTVVFEFAGDLWSVPRAGGNAFRLTSSPGTEAYPRFSPDGKQIAFSGTYDGNVDVYVIPAEGGSPKRLTSHPQVDLVQGWTSDGREVLFTSAMLQNTDTMRLFTVPLSAKPPKALPLPSGSQGSFSGDGKRLAYNPGFKWQEAWKRYRGGQTSPIWIADLSDSKVKEVPRKNSNDHSPIWLGDTVYFLSDRKGVTTLFAYGVNDGKVTQLLPAEGEEMKSLSLGANTLAIEKFGSIILYNIAEKSATEVPVRINGDFAEIRPKHASIGSMISSASISPTGQRVAFESRGDIVTVPAEKGDPRNVTQSSDAADRMPSWSPDGQSLAYLSDESGEYQLVVSSSSGKKSYVLGEAPAYYFNPNFSPDGQSIVYTDNRHKIWILNLVTGANTLVDESAYENPLFQLAPRWSPDSKWLTYAKELDSHMSSVFLYEVGTKKRVHVTDGIAGCRNPVFDAGGEYLYFTASTNEAPGIGWLDISSLHTLNVTSSLYCVVLKNDVPTPLAPESDDEQTGKPQEAKPIPFRIDIDGLQNRIVALPVRSANYLGLIAGSGGSVFLLEAAPIATAASQPQTTLHKYEMASRSASPFAQGVQAADISNDRKKLLIMQSGRWSIVSTAAPPPPSAGTLNLSAMTARVDPKAEWKQMFTECWRIQRDFLYDPYTHGLNIPSVMKRYEPFLEGICSRSDLNTLFEEMLGEVCVGHMFVGGGDIPEFSGTPGGLLGADFELVNGRYRFSRIYTGESWNPGVRAPLSAPGVAVKAGEYLISINEKNLTSEDDIYLALEGTSGKQVKLRISSSPSGSPSRDVVVLPVGSELALRFLSWVEDNRRKVDEMSNGKVGYVHVPDTGLGGWTSFNRYFFSQTDKEGFVIDERFNHGGYVNDYMVEVLGRPLRSMWTARYGKDFPSPVGAVYGPKVMLINQYAGSGGDYFPWLFREAKIGPIVGKRTWGGLVGILNFPTLLDGGGVTAPNVAFYNPRSGEWEIENYGVPPDIDVELDPYLWRQGRDAQLERGVQEVMKRLTGKPTIKKPKYADKTKVSD